MNITLLNRVMKHILEEPRRLLMQSWLVRKGYEEDQIECSLPTSEYNPKFRPFPPCDTAACIAGWTCILEGKGKSKRLDLMGKRLLGLDKKQAERLFIPDSWPKQFRRGLRDNGTRLTAETAVARIKHFIKTKGDE